MSIGDTLAEARRQSGLTVTQVSERTRIRETIIRGIEQNDFSACGGDFYARGHIRSIAAVVGADPDPLIRDYDAEHGALEAIRAADVFEPSRPLRIRERRSLNWSVAMIIALLVVIGYGAYHLCRRRPPTRSPRRLRRQSRRAALPPRPRRPHPPPRPHPTTWSSS